MGYTGISLVRDTKYSEGNSLLSLVEELVLSGLPLVSSVIAIQLQAFSLGVIRSLVLLLFVCSILILIRKVRTGWINGKLAGLAVIVGFLGWYAFPAIINYYSVGNSFLNDLPVSVNYSAAIWAVSYLSLFLFVWVLAGNCFDKIRLTRPVFRNVFYETNPVRLTLLGIACCMVGFVPYAFSGMGIPEIISLVLQSRLAEKPWIHTENLGNLRSPFLYLSQSAMVAGACILWLVSQEKSYPFYRRIVIGVFAFLISLLIFFDQGTRSIIGLIILPFLIIKLIDTWKRSKMVFTISAITFGVIFIAILQYQLLFRISGESAGLSYPQLLKWFTLDDTTDMFSETVYSLNLVPALHGYFKESVLVQFIVSPIPRFVWPSKPASEVIQFYTLHRWGIDIYEGGGNVFPGIVGQFYMSWGLWGPIVLGGFMGWLSSRVDGFLAHLSHIPGSYLRAVGVMMSVWILLSYRVLSPGLLYPVVMVYLLIRLSSVQRTT